MCHSLCLKILQSFAIALEIPQSIGGRHWFEDRHRYEAQSGDGLRILHYPNTINKANKEGEKKGEGKNRDLIIRAGSHSDYGSLTILFQKDIGGLEILSTDNDSSNNNNNSPRWISAPIIPNCVLVNLGDLIEFWSKGLFKSTIHRVTYNNSNNDKDNGRYSIAYFCHAEDDVSLDPIPSKIIGEFEEDIRIWKKIGKGKSEYGTKMTAGDHLKYKLGVSYKNG